jgi:hypothetical protein
VSPPAWWLWDMNGGSSCVLLLAPSRHSRSTSVRRGVGVRAWTRQAVVRGQEHRPEQARGLHSEDLLPRPVGIDVNRSPVARFDGGSKGGTGRLERYYRLDGALGALTLVCWVGLAPAPNHGGGGGGGYGGGI